MTRGVGKDRKIDVNQVFSDLQEDVREKVGRHQKLQSFNFTI